MGMDIETYIRLRNAAGHLEETPHGYGSCCELEMQGRLYGGEFGLAWSGVDGETVEVIHFGEWNRERGPDFLNTCVRIDGVERRGDIELDPEDVDWERHGHSRDSRYDSVVLHIFSRASRKRFFTRTSQNRAVVQVLLPAEMAKKRRIVATTADTSISLDAAQGLIRAGAHFRLARKRETWLRAESLHGRDEALFQALATSLGYKNNKIPFLLVAQRTGLAQVKHTDGEARLFGIAGFLAARPFDEGDTTVRDYLRTLWNDWWKIRDQEERLVLPADAWNFAGVRPSNHPHRRLAALAAIARDFRKIATAFSAGDATALTETLESVTHPFFSNHATLNSKKPMPACALIGAQRTADILANILAPTLPIDRGLALLEKLHPGSPISRAAKAADWLGLDIAARRKALGSALGQQGLLQVFEDFYPVLPDVAGF